MMESNRIEYKNYSWPLKDPRLTDTIKKVIVSFLNTIGNFFELKILSFFLQAYIKPL